MKRRSYDAVDTDLTLGVGEGGLGVGLDGDRGGIKVRRQQASGLEDRRSGRREDDAVLPRVGVRGGRLDCIGDAGFDDGVDALYFGLFEASLEVDL